MVCLSTQALGDWPLLYRFIGGEPCVCCHGASLWQRKHHTDQTKSFEFVYESLRRGEVQENRFIEAKWKAIKREEQRFLAQQSSQQAQVLADATDISAELGSEETLATSQRRS